MRRSSSDLKALSRQALGGQWGLPVAACLLIFICSIILTLVISAAAAVIRPVKLTEEEKSDEIQ